MSALLELAERCEAATELQTRALLIDAGEAVLIANGCDVDIEGTTGWLDHFEALIGAGAYLDAAMQLVPEGWRLFDMCETVVECDQPWYVRLRERPATDLLPDSAHSDGATPALALCAAALRAIAHITPPSIREQ